MRQTMLTFTVCSYILIKTIFSHNILYIGYIILTLIVVIYIKFFQLMFIYKSCKFDIIMYFFFLIRYIIPAGTSYIKKLFDLIQEISDSSSSCYTNCLFTTSEMTAIGFSNNS